jgi:non-specific serine/threonine protein kinase/serine/threonine-protein kinase
VTEPNWDRVKQIFGDVIELPRTAREAWLENECGADKELRSELESLLSSYDAEEGLNRSPETAESLDQFGVGKRIGRYEIVRRVGVGGMGAVFLAVRADDTFRKYVAIKVVHAAIESEEGIQRFRDERQLLATLDHPNIARLVDGGVTADGLPFFAMDFIEGVRIDQYCAERLLSIDERIRLFCKVCSAVEYVHQNLVVHRDLKPSNILVTPDGVPKLLDFGIAKVLSADGFGKTTRADLRPMTPGYASPEQILGKPITTASDVYSLGVILYELFTSKSPYRLQGASPQETLTAVCEQEPRPPSAVTELQSNRDSARNGGTLAIERKTSSARLVRKLKGDLDNIALKALRKEPDRRYASVSQLADDLHRYLEGLPVSAHRDTWAYRAGKFVRRHAVGVAAAAMIVVSLSAGICVAVWQAYVAEKERNSALDRFNDVRQLATSFLFEFDGAIRNLKGATPARKLMVQRALEYLNKLDHESQGNQGLENEVAAAYLRVGDVQGNPYGPNVGDTEGARLSYTNALRISRALVARDQHNSSAQINVARSLKSLGQVLPVLGQPHDGLADIRIACDLFEKLSRASDSDTGLRLEFANCLLMRGDLEGHTGLQNLGDTVAAGISYQKASEVYRDLVATHSDPKAAEAGLAMVNVRIADIALSRGDLKGSLTQYSSALKAAQQLSADDPANAGTLHLVALGYRKVGAVQEESGDQASALRSYATAAKVNEDLLNSDPENAQAAMSQAITLRYIGDLLSKRGDAAGAMAEYRTVQETLDHLAVEQPDNVLVQGRRAEMLIYIADLLERAGKTDDARKETLLALEITRKLAAREDATADELYAYALTTLDCQPPDLRNPTAALQLAQRSSAKSNAPDRDILELLARAYFATGDRERAIETEQTAIKLIPKSDSGSADRRRMNATLSRYRKGVH